MEAIKIDFLFHSGIRLEHGVGFEKICSKKCGGAGSRFQSDSRIKWKIFFDGIPKQDLIQEGLRRLAKSSSGFKYLNYLNMSFYL